MAKDGHCAKVRKKAVSLDTVNEDSGFFANPAPVPTESGPMECIHRSENGWSELYRIDRNGRFRVLKALKPEYRGKALYEQLLLKEYEIGYSLSHPCICEVYGFSSIPDLGNAIEMEWIDGCTLEQLLQDGRLGTQESQRIAGQLCDALSYIHSKQIVHRDLKPANVLVTHNGKNVKIIDFGLSDADSYAVLKGAAGTRSHAAPELLAGASADSRTDIWSLGVILRRMIPRRPSVIRKCMASDPSRRYADAAEVKDALHRPGLWWIIPVALAVLAAILWLSLHPEPVSVEPEQQAPDSESVVSDPAVIDELFRQATEMLE
jgi:serine/threonine protein kinase